jgi:hypothetical protein
MTSDEQFLVADFANHPALVVLRRKAKEHRDQHFQALGRALYSDPSSYREAEMYQARGFYKGVFFVLNQVEWTKEAVQRELAKKEEAEAS